MDEKKKRRKLYRSRSPIKIILIVFVAFVLVIAIAVISVFFAFRKYIVYTDNGVELQIPWIEEYLTEDNTN